MDVFTETLRSWQNFYFMTGGAAATLVGLMFVALSLGMHLVSDTTREDIKTFVTPSVFYFVSALLIACVMLIPVIAPTTLALLLGVGGAMGLGVSLQTARRLIEIARPYQDFERDDWLAQVIGPIGTYALLLLTAGGFALNQWSLAFAGAWVAMALLLVCAITNTWSLVMWIIEQRRE